MTTYEDTYTTHEAFRSKNGNTVHWTERYTDEDAVLNGGSIQVVIPGDGVMACLIVSGRSTTGMPAPTTTVWMPRIALDPLLDMLADAHAGTPDPTVGVDA